MALAHVVVPGLLTTVERNVEIDCESQLCRGRTVVDLWRRTGRAANAQVATDVDAAAFLDLLIERYASLG
jgi:inosine-uridine nucleoside N-ribohydrolase